LGPFIRFVLVSALVLCASVPAFSQRDAGWDSVERGDWTRAREMFRQTLSNRPGDSQAAFGYALTVWLGVSVDPLTASNLAADGWTDPVPGALWFAELLQQPALPDLSKFSNLSGHAVADWQSMAERDLLPAVLEALSRLETAEKGWKEPLVLDGNLLAAAFSGRPAAGTADLRRVDLAAVDAFDAGMSAFAAALEIFLSHDLDCNCAAISAMFEGGSFRSGKYYNPFADPAFPGFGELRPGAAGNYSRAKDLLSRVSDKGLRAVALLEADSGDRQDAWLPAFPAKTLSDMRSLFSALKSSLSGRFVNPVAGFGIAGVPELSAGRFLAAPLSLRALFLDVGTNGEPLLFDVESGAEVKTPVDGTPYAVRLKSPTFGGLLQEPLSGAGGLFPLIASYRSDLTPLGNVFQALWPAEDYTYDPDHPRKPSGGSRKRDN